MEATPLAHEGEVAVATKWTGEPAVVPLDGELTETPANAGTAKIANRHTATESFPKFISKSPAYF
jgi:hypothetical protein